MVLNVFLGVISFFIPGVLIALTYYLMTANKFKNYSSKYKFIELTELETKYVFLINVDYIVCIYCIENGALISFKKSNEIVELAVSESYSEINRLLGIKV